MSWRIQENFYYPQKSVKTINLIPNGTYYVRYDLQLGYYLEQIENFKLPSKIYGNTEIVNRWLTSYKVNTRNTGIVLTGIKGSGKTLLSKKCAIDSKLPIIIIDTAYTDSDFISFITNPELGDVCIFIDEFEKIFIQKEEINTLLTLLDGTFNTHNLFIFTCNQMHTNEYLVNRPSRIRYRSHFESLPDEVINEVIADLLNYKEHTDSIKSVLQAIGIITFDLLIALINEINLFNESATEAVKHLNITYEQFEVDIIEIWKDKPYIIHTNQIMSFEDYDISIYRNFSLIHDPEYCDEDLSNDVSPYKGLPTEVIIPLSEFKQINNDLWKYDGVLGKFYLKRSRYRQLIF